MKRTVRTASRAPLAVLAAALALAAAACAGDDDDAPSSTTAGGESGVVDDIGELEQAVVRIVAEGSFVEPGDALESIEVTGVGTGSGFVVDPSGVAVTNNHVVAGAASIEVYVGDADEPVPARVLGVSECNDLAVIDLDGEGYPTLAWYDGEVTTGLEVRAAGFPLGDPEFTLTSGIVSKAEADGDTPWASIPFAIEHDANIQPGNSGGPLVDAERARVVAVNYATNDPGTGTNQFFAISATEAREVVDTLAGGTDVLSFGINGQAILEEDLGVLGIWVASVASGSPAEEAGIEAGDVIERLEGLPMSTDGTMREYCDVLRSHDPDDVVSVQVLRVGDGVRLRGELNGDELEPYESLVDDVEEGTGGTLAPGESYEYETLRDDTGVLVVDVPTAWADRTTSTVEVDDGGEELPQIIAAADVGEFLDTYDVPGMSFIVDSSGDTGIDDFLALSDFTGDCVSEGPEPYDDGLYEGQIEYWTDCGTSGAVVVVIAAAPPGEEFTVRVVAQLLTDADVEALDRIVQTFRVVS